MTLHDKAMKAAMIAYAGDRPHTPQIGQHWVKRAIKTYLDTLFADEGMVEIVSTVIDDVMKQDFDYGGGIHNMNEVCLAIFQAIKNYTGQE